MMDEPGNDQQQRRADRVGYVYFLETTGGEYVKIGYSINPIRRLSELGTLRPGNYELRPIGYMRGGRSIEAWLHGLFAECRENGEWFACTDRLRSFIDTFGLQQFAIPSKAPVRPKRPRRSRLRMVIEPEQDTGSSGIAVGTVVEAAAPMSVYLATIGSRGGKTSSANMTPEQRSARAKKAVTARELRRVTKAASNA